MTVLQIYSTKKHEYIDLVQRDWEILSFLEQQGFSTFEQLFKRFFKSNHTCSRRLSRLTSFGLISSSRIMDFFLKPTDNGKTPGLPLVAECKFKSNNLIFYLSERFRKKYAFSEALLKREMLIHQLILSDLRNTIDPLIKHQIALSDPEIKVLSKIEIGRHEKIRPDISYESVDMKVAVELERSNKSKSRYYERFLYYDDSIYKKAIYYSTNRRNIDYLLNQTKSFEKIGVGFHLDPTIIFHNLYGKVSLTEFLEL